MHCAIEAPNFNFTIKWKWQASLTSETKELLSTDISITNNGFRSRLLVRNLESHAGIYWCLAELFNGTNLEDSSKFTLLNRDEYESGLVDCSSTMSFSVQSISKCIYAAPSVIETLPPNFKDETGTSTLPDQTTPPSPDDLGPALYAVIAVILVFCLVIVTLSIAIVVLYRRGCARQRHFKTSGEQHVIIHVYTVLSALKQTLQMLALI